MQRMVTGLALILSASVPVEAAETWSPASTTAIAITGEISIDGNRLTFGNGVSISLEPVGADRPGVYVIDPPQNPVLMNGNRLCGEEMPKFLVLARAGDSLYFKAFDSPEAPVASADPLPQSGTCATYNFERANDHSSGDVPPGQAGHPAYIRQAQDALNALGYDAGPVDGVMGRRTREALDAFQRDRGIPVTGTADQRTLSELGEEGQASGPSFNCRKAGNPVERAICASPALSRLDTELAAAYKIRIASLSSRSADDERARQRQWIGERDRCGAALACLKAAYSERIAVLTGSARSAAPAATIRVASGDTPGSPVAGPEEGQEPAASDNRDSLPTFRDCDDCPQMVVLPAGSYWMGATEKDAEIPSAEYSIPSELPRHEVTFDYSFAIGKFTITVAEFAAFADETGHKTGGECFLMVPVRGPNKSKFIGTIAEGANEWLRGDGMALVEHADFRQPGALVDGNHPATCISRDEAKLYLAWLSDKTGRAYRFPTEAEWEYATRAGEPLPFYYGKGRDELCAHGHFGDRDSVYVTAKYAACAEKPSLEGAYPVGTLIPNNWGLHDMVGNVFEFTEDCYFPTYEGAPADGSPWMKSTSHGPEWVRTDGSCVSHTLRSYDFSAPDWALRSAMRCGAYSNDSERGNNVGMRVAVSMEGGAWDRN